MILNFQFLIKLNFHKFLFKEQEARTEYLRDKARSRKGEIKESATTSVIEPHEPHEHVNFFKDLEDGVSS